MADEDELAEKFDTVQDALDEKCTREDGILVCQDPFDEDEVHFIENPNKNVRDAPFSEHNMEMVFSVHDAEDPPDPEEFM